MPALVTLLSLSAFAMRRVTTSLKMVTREVVTLERAIPRGQVSALLPWLRRVAIPVKTLYRRLGKLAALVRQSLFDVWTSIE